MVGLKSGKSWKNVTDKTKRLWVQGSDWGPLQGLGVLVLFGFPPYWR